MGRGEIVDPAASERSGFWSLAKMMARGAIAERSARQRLDRQDSLRAKQNTLKARSENLSVTHISVCWTPGGTRKRMTVNRWSDIFRDPPFSRCGPPQANSTISIPRVTSPLASSSVLPCSREITAASLSEFCSSKTLNFCSTWDLRNGVIDAQLGRA